MVKQLHQRTREDLWMSSIKTSVRPLMQPSQTFLPVNCKNVGFSLYRTVKWVRNWLDGMSKELESMAQIQTEPNNEWCPSRVHSGTNIN